MLRVYSANCPSDWPMMPVTLLSDFRAFPCKTTNTSSGRSHTVSSDSSSLFFSQIRSIVVRVLLSILTRPDLVGDLQGQVEILLQVDYFTKVLLRSCFFSMLIIFPSSRFYILLSYIFVNHLKFILEYRI